MSTGEQLGVLDGFRKNAFNVLVATNVIEEGLDVRACNVVIKVDPVTNFRSFIQSQGRARAAHSYYVLMAEDKLKCQSTVESFRRLERELTVALRDRCVDSVEEEEVLDSVFNLDKQSYKPFGDDGPRITPSSAASVLMRYVATLKTDASYTLKILYSHKKMALGGYQVQLLLPPPLQGLLLECKDVYEMSDLWEFSRHFGGIFTNSAIASSEAMLSDSRLLPNALEHQKCITILVFI
ncbi:unnamed protein product [Dibothriocephalus latus]|uniref:Helicase C-terminal domain-containing protein n=1 Tax=Dibothriocephalus latus TaxID=60516 RepID=A0A3P7LUA2_DIBLA|nr:unnamed protein product [Dibothriocephalus latus]